MTLFNITQFINNSYNETGIDSTHPTSDYLTQSAQTPRPTAVGPGLTRPNTAVGPGLIPPTPPILGPTIQLGPPMIGMPPTATPVPPVMKFAIYFLSVSSMFLLLWH